METIFTVDEAAKTLKVDAQTIRRMLQQGRLKGRKLGKAWRIPESALRHAVAPTPREYSDDENSKGRAMSAAAILAGLDSDDPTKRNAAIMALSQADAQTSALVEEQVARSVAEYSGPEDDWSDWRALDSEPFHFPDDEETP